jgi:hypothetical protein
VAKEKPAAGTLSLSDHDKAILQVWIHLLDDAETEYSAKEALEWVRGSEAFPFAAQYAAKAAEVLTDEEE